MRSESVSLVSVKTLAVGRLLLIPLIVSDCTTLFPTPLFAEPSLEYTTHVSLSKETEIIFLTKEYKIFLSPAV